MEISQLQFEKEKKKNHCLVFPHNSPFLCVFFFSFFFLFFSGEHEEEELVCQETQVTQEMLEEQVVRLLTREVLELLSK